MTMPDDVKGRVLEHGEILRIASHQPDLDALPGRQVFYGLQLGGRDVEDSCLRAQLGENHGVPAPSRGKVEDVSPRQSHALEAPAGIHEAAHTRSRPGRPTEGTGVVHCRLGEALPHRLVVLGDFVDAPLGRSHQPSLSNKSITSSPLKTQDKSWPRLTSSPAPSATPGASSPVGFSPPATRSEPSRTIRVLRGTLPGSSGAPR